MGKQKKEKFELVFDKQKQEFFNKEIPQRNSQPEEKGPEAGPVEAREEGQEGKKGGEGREGRTQKTEDVRIQTAPDRGPGNDSRKGGTDPALSASDPKRREHQRVCFFFKIMN